MMMIIKFLLTMVWVSLMWGALTESNDEHRRRKMASVAVFLFLILILICYGQFNY
jgi:glycerol uptake facilitator-like aquaporin